MTAIDILTAFVDAGLRTARRAEKPNLEMIERGLSPTRNPCFERVRDNFRRRRLKQPTLTPPPDHGTIDS
jgi:hypothetical protein